MGVEFDNTPYPAEDEAADDDIFFGATKSIFFAGNRINQKRSAVSWNDADEKEISVERNLGNASRSCSKAAGLPLFLAASLASSNVRFLTSQSKTLYRYHPGF